jgi:toxin ParE1/3/4
MANLIYAEQAKDDLRKIWSYISEKSQNGADRLIDELIEKFKLLAENPKIGRTHDEFIVNLRSFPHKSYIIFYFPIENGVEIYRVLHGARNIEDLFENYFEGLKP